jgi:hypothetical protein
MSQRIRLSRHLLLAAAITGMVFGVFPLSGAEAANANFISKCTYSHSAPDDPIVYPRQPGASHPHDFFGNRSTNASSTYASLRGASSTTCELDGDSAAYWTPALYDSGRLVAPTRATVYYRNGGKDPSSIRAFPAGLKVVAKDGNLRTFWACQRTPGGGANQSSIPTCPDGYTLAVRYRFPDCWDGRNLDSADHTSHMRFAVRSSCPSSHPKPMPLLTLNVHYPSDGGDIVLGSPDMPVAPHADFFNAWNQPRLDRLVFMCLRSGRNCGSNPPA